MSTPRHGEPSALVVWQGGRLIVNLFTDINHPRYYRPKRSFGQGNIFTPVCHSFCSQGGSTWPGTPPGPGTPPWDQVHPPRPGTPPGTRYTPPGTRYPPSGTRSPPWTRYPPSWDQVHPSWDQVHPSWDQVHPPGTRYTPRDQVHPPPEQQPPEYGQRSAGTHPTGMHSCSICGPNDRLANLALFTGSICRWSS